MVRAKPVFKAQYGFSIEIDAIDPEYTLGDLEARKREIRTRLQQEGIYDANKKLSSPWDFNAVLVVAPQGAAGLGDFQAEATRLERFGICRFVYATSRFQGEGAANEIKQALQSALQHWRDSAMSTPDAVVIIRGGGAVNDLAWLNDYELAKHICTMKIPVLTGIGHERDNTILDEVSNIRFDTPSKV
ncbi:MAG: exodeoxyribonuclease VII large subunit, partial [Azonexus sp.]|nr:exodeoxyribonuclease VII large subunit [Azonexus sp.]